MKPKTKSILESLEKTANKYWNISPETGQFLNLLIKDREYKTILEIGTSNGYSGIWIAEALSQTKGRLYTMESHKKGRFELAKENFKKSGLSKYISQIHGHAPEEIPKKPIFFDLAFFDATKLEHPLYFEEIKNRIKKNGMIITDNAISHKKELEPYKKLLKSDTNWHCEELTIGSGLFISIRKHSEKNFYSR